MAENSKIEWTDHTFNPWVGCQKVSDGCKFCYAETLMDHRYGRVKWGPQGTRQRTSEANWRKPLQWNRQAEKEGIRRRVFCASLADVFEDRHGKDALNLWRAQLWRLIELTPNLDWLLLTKRPENVQQMAPDQWWDNWPAHVWIGTSVENQAAADERIPHLLKIPAKVRFLSCEPLLGPVNISEIRASDNLHYMPLAGTEWPEPRIHWVIVGGESGHNARPMHPDWARSLRDQCQAAGVAFFFKQWGEYVAGYGTRIGYVSLDNKTYLCGDKNTHEWGAGIISHKVGKHAAGRLLDGAEWNEYPR